MNWSWIGDARSGALHWILAAALALAAGAAASRVAPLQPAPDFSARTANGETLRLQTQKGQVVLLNFWASWCAPCRQELPHLNRLHQKYQAAGLVLVGVNVDDDPRAGSELAKTYGILFPLVYDSDKKISRLYDMGAMPATVVIDRAGRARHVHLGYQSGLEVTYDQQIRALLKE